MGDSDGNDTIGENDESFTTVMNKKTEKKRRQKEEKERKKKEDEKRVEDKKKDCSFFLKGLCRHGFKGTKPHGGKNECSFNHPMLCRAYINYGTCNKGNECDKKHPELCKNSKDTKKCPNIKNGGRCRQGYHIKDTVPDYGIPEERGPVPNGSNGSKNGEMNSNIEDFLSNVVRREMGIIWREMMTPKPNLPQMKEQTGRDYLWALLGKNLQSNV